jgi:hypothetical protein
MVFLARRTYHLGPPDPLPRFPRPQEAVLTNNDFPQFDIDEVALLITAVQKALERLKRANEARGGNDPEFLEYGRRYSVILQKLESVAANGGA